MSLGERVDNMDTVLVNPGNQRDASWAYVDSR